MNITLRTVAYLYTTVGEGRTRKKNNSTKV